MSETVFREEEFNKRLDPRLWWRILQFARPYRPLVGGLMTIALLVGLTESLYNLLVKRVIDGLVEFGPDAPLFSYALQYAAITITLVVCVFIFIRFAGKLSAFISHDIRRAGFARLQELSFSFYDHRPVGWLMARMTSDCERLSSVLAWGLLDLTWGTAFMSAIAVILFYLNWKLALIVFTVVPVLAWISLHFQRVILRSSRLVRKINSRLTGSFNEGISAVRTTKTLVREEGSLREFASLAGEMRRASIRNAVQSALYFPLVITIGSAGAGLAIWFGGRDVLAGVISLGTLVAFVSYSRDFFMPVQELARLFTNLQMAQASAERIIGLVDTEPEIRDSAEVRTSIARAGAQPPVAGRAIDGLPDRIETIEFRGVSFAYNVRKPMGADDASAGEREVIKVHPVLDDFNFQVQAGQTIALVGPTGGGKSTIISLLCRFYEPTAGEILINGIDYRRRSLHWLQSNLGIVLQSPHLFSGTIRENIAYGRLEASDEEIVRAAQLVNAHEFIMAMPGGYGAQVGEGGVNLSTGQKQLISFARAILADPQVFVMDEATSSIDTETERLIQAGIERVLSNRTSFVIAHRLSTIRRADCILVIEKGRIAEQGTHEQLLAARGHYHDLYTHQFTREAEEQVLADPLLA
ncbi:MAG TPA: ABC transporter ATP-binding protein [Candidatus Sumerlaeota bacterium]|nr:ABC transporter ATP-binding protein [Candidatus Sumerlaeota bacterium]HPK01001.1 ABC transporter ATP-binding protein [Candidatus Sumerlaeota bacterium]